MFTGIVREVAIVSSINTKENSSSFVLNADEEFLKDIKDGDSISVNGACMTVESKTENSFNFTAVFESLNKTNLGLLKVNDPVNLERSMTLSATVDGHLVSGHVDCTGKVSEISKSDEGWELYVRFPAEFSKNVIYKGSICINGISLTVAEITDEGEDHTEVKIAVIPHTLENTNLKDIKEKDIVNLEFDIIGKYINRMLPVK